MNESHIVCNLILKAIYMQIVANYCESLTLDSYIKSWMSEGEAVDIPGGSLCTAPVAQHPITLILF